MRTHTGVLLLVAALTSGSNVFADDEQQEDLEAQLANELRLEADEMRLEAKDAAQEAKDSAQEARDKAREMKDRMREANERQREAMDEARDNERQQKDLDAQLEAARERLDEAAQEVSELTSQIIEPTITAAFEFYRAPRAILGVQVHGKKSARIEKVSPGGPAAEAGIRTGDVIVALNGEKIEGADGSRAVIRQMREVEPNGKVKVRVLRDGKPLDFVVTARPVDRDFMPRPPAPPLPPEPPRFPSAWQSWRHELSGMEFATLTPGLGEYFGTEKGVLVVRASESGTYKLKDGDVILSIDGREPRSGSHATRILTSYQSGEKINLQIMRQRKPMSLEVTSPESAQIRMKKIISERKPTRLEAMSPESAQSRVKVRDVKITSKQKAMNLEATSPESAQTRSEFSLDPDLDDDAL